VISRTSTWRVSSRGFPKTFRMPRHRLFIKS
jgi:hypothetical protein